MSDTPQGPGWFQAADGKWYPPQPPAPPAKSKSKGLLIGLGACGALFILFLVVAALAGGSKDDEATANTPTTTAKAASSESPTTEAPPAEPENGPEITKAEFDQIQNGMTPDEVNAIVGAPGETLSETGSPGSQFYTLMVMWYGEDEISNANVMYQGGTVMSKSQFGLS